MNTQNNKSALVLGTAIFLGLAALGYLFGSTVDKFKGYERTVTVKGLAELGREGIAFSQSGYEAQTEYIFTGLNELKPKMVEQSTKEARRVAQKFAEDSDSVLGRI